MLRETIEGCDNRDVLEVNICRIAEIGEGAPITIYYSTIVVEMDPTDFRQIPEVVKNNDELKLDAACLAHLFAVMPPGALPFLKVFVERVQTLMCQAIDGHLG